MTAIGGLAAERLQSFVERIERLEEEKQAIADDIKEVKAEARSAGFDVKTINRIIKRRRMTQDRRDEEDALLDIYEGALGMLEDTPLGEAARRRLSRKPPPRRDDADDQDEEPAPPPPEPVPEATVEEAREWGAEAAGNGTPVTANPFPAGDPCRAAWDEGWCKADGSDGMDIPEAWRRKKPKKDDKPDGHDDAGGEDAD